MLVKLIITVNGGSSETLGPLPCQKKKSLEDYLGALQGTYEGGP